MSTKKPSKTKNEATEQHDKEASEQKIQELTDALQRLQAEFENFKKRSEKEALQYASSANEELLQRLLPVLDDLKRACAHSADEGLQQILRKFEDVLTDVGVRKIEAESSSFAPQLHEAMLSEPTKKREEDNQIVKVIEDGYMLGEQVLRHARVIVAKYNEEHERKDKDTTETKDTKEIKNNTEESS
jgi:molecular chaperone GrpE